MESDANSVPQEHLQAKVLLHIQDGVGLHLFSMKVRAHSWLRLLKEAQGLLGKSSES